MCVRMRMSVSVRVFACDGTLANGKGRWRGELERGSEYLAMCIMHMYPGSLRTREYHPLSYNLRRGETEIQ